MLLPELRPALDDPNPVFAIADALVHRPTVLERLTAPALADWAEKFRVALQASPNFYRHTFDAVPYGGIRLDGQVALLREVSGDAVIEGEYWAGDRWPVHPATALIRILVERLVSEDCAKYLRTRQVLAELAPNWNPKPPTPTEVGKSVRIL